MPPRTWKLHLEDLIDAIERIDLYTEDLTFETFSQDEKTVDAVLKNTIVVGEAVGRLPAHLLNKNIDIPWKQMRRLRNITVHEYFKIDLSILWQTIQEDMLPLLPRLRQVQSLSIDRDDTVNL